LVALVTGASRGLGPALARRVAAAGATTAVTARSLTGRHPGAPQGLDTTLRDTVDAITAAGGSCEAFTADLSEPAAPEGLVREVVDRFGRIDILINNAARAVYLPIERWNSAAISKLFNVNVLAPLALASLVISGMKERGFGAIVNVSSIVADHPIGPPYGIFERESLITVYAMAKAALDRMSSGLAIECVQYGVRINSISPSGGVRTPGALAASSMLNRFPHYGEPPETMAEAVLALCENRMPMITGCILTSGALLADLSRPVRALNGGPFTDPLEPIDLRDRTSSPAALADAAPTLVEPGRGLAKLVE
jgi:NAD(P)-dependent dehydrogenase (short-subunit alcohol dehydrogenase family)